MTVLLALGISFGVSLLVTPALRWLSHRHDLLDHPNERSSHDRPTPRSGGIAILAAGVLPILMSGGVAEPPNARLLLCAVAVAALGLLDDVVTLRAGLKLFVQVAVAGATVVLLGVTLRVVEVPGLGDLRFPYWIGIALSLFWIVGVTNAFNFMDGVNGIASIEAIVCALAYAVMFQAHGDVYALLLCLGIAGGTAGFLSFNASGSIFMGDVGSATLGFLFAVLALRLADASTPFLAVVLPLMPFLIDAAMTLVRRAKRGERLFVAHRTHAYQRLIDLGWSHMAISLTYGLLAGSCSILAVCWRLVPSSAVLSGFLLLSGLMIAGSMLVERRAARRQA